jgi:hypothetical protein
MDIRAIADETLAYATGRVHREEPVLSGTGGPAGNATLTAWTGLILLVLFAAEVVTLLDVRGLVSWHVAIGVLLIPPALLKTATTGWRIVRFYGGNRPYRAAGPPPLLLRLLGPLVVMFTLAVLGSGLVLVLIGRDGSERGLFDLSGRAVTAVAIHKATFVLWAVVTGAHALARLVPAVELTVRSRRTRRSAVPGGRGRAGIVAVVLAGAVGLTIVVMGAVDLSAWHARHERIHRALVDDH